MGSGAPDHTVSYGTVLSRDAFPGTSCLATIMLSLRDKKPCRCAINDLKRSDVHQPCTKDLIPIWALELASRREYFSFLRR